MLNLIAGILVIMILVVVYKRLKAKPAPADKPEDAPKA